MRRRDFIAIIGGAVVTWPIAVRSLQAEERKRRIGILMPFPEQEPHARARVAAFLKELETVGWSENRNLQIDYRWVGERQLEERNARDLIALRPEVILTASNSTTTLLSRLTKTIPIVFGSASVATETGLIDNMAHPAGNVTGFTQIESSITGKYLDLLKEATPRLKRVLIVQTRTIASRSPAVRALMGLVTSSGREAVLAPTDEAASLQDRFAEFASRDGANGVIVMSSPLNTAHSQHLIALALRHRLPAIYPYRHFAAGGGLMSYGPDLLDQFRKAAHYVDRILRGEKPGDLPVQAPTKYEFVINLKTAKALDLEIPAMLLARADGVVE